MGAFILSNCKKILNIFVFAVHGFKDDKVYYNYTGSLYIEKPLCEFRDKQNLVREAMH